MRRLFTVQMLGEQGLTRSAIRWGERRGRWRWIQRGVYGEGPEEPTELDRALAEVVASGGVASGRVAGILHGLDGVELRTREVTLPFGSSNSRRGARRRRLPRDRVVVVGGVRCTDGLQTLIDLASELDDSRWEQALESALRKQLVTIPGLEVQAAGIAGVARIRRVLSLRPVGAPPTESLLETLFVQLARTVPGLEDPVRQHIVYDDGGFVARVDFAWPQLGLFIELDGQHHKGQPVYDASRQTAVAAATGWLCCRFTWHQIVHVPTTSARKLAAVATQARRRPSTESRRS